MTCMSCIHTALLSSTDSKTLSEVFPQRVSSLLVLSIGCSDFQYALKLAWNKLQQSWLKKGNGKVADVLSLTKITSATFKDSVLRRYFDRPWSNVMLSFANFSRKKQQFFSAGTSRCIRATKNLSTFCSFHFSFFSKIELRKCALIHCLLYLSWVMLIGLKFKVFSIWIGKMQISLKSLQFFHLTSLTGL